LNRPATHISGDFYNFFELPDGRTAVVIGDVTGHGTAAAFLMATTQLLIRNTLPRYCDPGPCLEDVNQQLTNQVFNGQFVTMQILVIDPRNGDVAIATAGHPAPLFSDGDLFHSVKLESQLVAGLDPQMHYPTEKFRLRPGSSLLLYTDGVVDTEDPAGNFLRLDGLKRGLKGPVDTAEVLLQRAVTAVNTFRRGQDLRDDLTMVAIHLLPKPRLVPAHAPIPTVAVKAVVAAPA
jgi:sigma-B regulation protein RsbU (phosphoserine phosphatase)